jgi:hypothetical protein
MGLFDFFKKLFGAGTTKELGRGVDELARRLATTPDQLTAVKPVYREFRIRKRSGGTREILAPDSGLKALQRRILTRLLARLSCHPAAMGFERGHSIVTNAACHTGQAVVVRMDLENFFQSTRASRILDYFVAIGWSDEASRLLVKLCTHRQGLPAGAPTSPRLSNLVNYRLDARLTGLAAWAGGVYTRYADDITFSFRDDVPAAIHAVIRATKQIVIDEGYRLHQGKKLNISRSHSRQIVTGLVVNKSVNLPRSTRRWLRAVEHHSQTGRPTTLSPGQVAGWQALRAMIASQAGG